jgi:hypothetical protein
MKSSPHVAGERRHRFSHRPKRIARRAERDRFAYMIVPVIWLLGLLGVAGIFIVGLHYLVSGESNQSWSGLAAVPLLSALALILYRFIRGHFHHALDEP